MAGMQACAPAPAPSPSPPPPPPPSHPTPRWPARAATRAPYAPNRPDIELLAPTLIAYAPLPMSHDSPLPAAADAM